MSHIKQTVESRRKYWKTLEERVQPDEATWNAPEFEQSRNEMAEEAAKTKFSRKDFVKIMGAGAVMLQAACRRPTEQIVPAVSQPAEYVPGEKLFYASATPEGTGILIHSREGRPMKIAGNPDHPISRGGVTASEIASLMDLYDPDRLRYPVQIRDGRKRRATEETIVGDAKSALDKGNYVILTGPVNSPSSRALIEDFMKAVPGGRHLELRPDPTLRQILEGQAASYGDHSIPLFRFDRAELVVSIEGDFMGTMPGAPGYTADFIRGRDLRSTSGKRYNSLVAIESMMTVTGSNAETRLPIRPGDALTVALSIAAHINNGLKQGKFAGNGTVSGLLAAYMPEAVASDLGLDAKVIGDIAARLWQFRGRSLVVSGSPQGASGKSAALAIAVNLLNSILDNDGATVDHSTPVTLSAGSSEKQIVELVEELRAGKVKALIVAGANPVYHLPSSLNVKEAIAKTGFVLSITDRADETALASKAALPVSHFLESWGDVEAVKGVRSVIQPAIRPLYATRSFEDYLILLAGGSIGGAADFHAYLKKRWADGGKGAFTSYWVSALQAGFVGGNLKGKSGGRNFNTAALQQLPVKPETAKGLRVGLYYNVQVTDGAGANNAYRQELPDPVTKGVWMNYAVILPETARSMKLKQGSVVRVKTASGSVDLPVLLQPGIHPDAVMIALGYGRTAAGKVGNDRGVNALNLVAFGTDSLVLSGIELSKEGLVAVGDRTQIPDTQTVYRNGRNTEDRAFFAPGSLPNAPYDGSSQYDRPLLLETTLEKFKQDPAGHHTYSPQKIEYNPNSSIMSGWNYEGIRWHMVIDLNACTGCGACVTSCNIENNIPMVGPEQVFKGREMHWMRIDRYYSGDEKNPTVAHQPMLCQHCENAPCENVCPVGATAHDTEGLNVMAYNRCVGTRYCANNCPYKVRRFNWFENWDYMEGLVRHLRDPQQLALNPDVTVRRRGVIEKCSLCIHRLNRARQDMKVKGLKRIVDGSVMTACQEVCPSGAIVSGDINDADSRVAKLAKDQRGYKVLDFLATNPSITYLAKVRNPVI